MQVYLNILDFKKKEEFMQFVLWRMLLHPTITYSFLFCNSFIQVKKPLKLYIWYENWTTHDALNFWHFLGVIGI